MVPSREPVHVASAEAGLQDAFDERGSTRAHFRRKTHKKRGGPPSTDSPGLTRDNLTVVHRKGHGENVLFVSDETTGGLSRGNIPESEFRVPAGRECEGSIGGNDDIRNEVGVSPKSATSIAVGVVLAGRGVRELPHHHGLVTRRGQQQVRVLGSRGEARHPVTMALQGSSQCEILRGSTHRSLLL